MQLTRKHIGHILHFVILPIVLVGSDFIIAFSSHYVGSTGSSNWFSIANFTDYLIHINLAELSSILIIPLVVIVIVEIITRYK